MKNQQDQKQFHDKERTPEVQDIINRMPTKFGFWITGLVLFIFGALLFFGIVIRYPDVVNGTITVNTVVSPIRLVANSAGKIKFTKEGRQPVVTEGEAIAYIQNATSFDSLQLLKKFLKDYNPNAPDNTSILKKLPQQLPLGELTIKYYTFLNSLTLLANYNENQLYNKKIVGLNLLLSEQKKDVQSTAHKLRLGKDNLTYVEKFFKRDSSLFATKIIPEAELDKAQLNLIYSKDNYENNNRLLITANKEVAQTLNQISETEIAGNEKKKELQLALVSSYADLYDFINKWEQAYVFKAPFSGTVQLLKFWTDDQYIQQGEEVFTIISGGKEIYGQVMLPAAGAGKVKPGQEAIVKLDSYPYLEYGSLKGEVTSVSLSTKTQETREGQMETYLVAVRLNDGLTTNYGKKLEFRQESKGAVEIITNDRKLLQRFFSNLKYILNR